MDKKISLEKLKKKCLNDLDDELKKNSKNLVFGKGNPNAKILFIGEAPGKKEDELGIPFVGRSGSELDKNLKKINLSLDMCYIANILKYRPPNNRNPNKLEIKNHTPYLINQIKIINPKIICTLGNFSTKFILEYYFKEKIKKSMGELRGKKYIIEKIIIFPLFHPAAILYNPKLRKIFEEDFLSIKKIIKKSTE